MELKENLAALRKEKGLSQNELAEEMHVSRQTISKWEVGSVQPSADNLIWLSKFYQVSLDELVGIAEKSETPSCAEENPEPENLEPAKPEPAKPSPAFSRKTVMIAFTIVVAVMIAVNVAVWMFVYRSLNQKHDNTSINISLSDMDSTDLDGLDGITFEEGGLTSITDFRENP